MIYLYSGTPGSGKSIHTSSIIYHQLSLGRPIIANFDINTDFIRHYKKTFLFVENDLIKPDFLLSYSKGYFCFHKFKEGIITLILDECQLLFNAREWQQSGRNKWLSFFTQHRKYGYDIILIAQFDRMIDRQIRSLIEYELIHRKVSNFGWQGKLFSLASGGNLFVVVKMWYPLKEKIGSEFFKAHKKYYRLYDSYNHFQSSG